MGLLLPCLLSFFLLSLALPTAVGLSSADSSPAVPPNALLLWSSTSNSTVGSSAASTSPYLVLSVPITVPHARAFLTLTNAANFSVVLALNGVAQSSPILPSTSVQLSLDNATFGSVHSFALMDESRVVVAGELKGVCVDCAVNVTLMAGNKTAVSVEQPSYALQYVDRDDESLVLTSSYVQPVYPAPLIPLGGEEGEGVSLVLNFTFTVPIASFNFYPQYVLRLLPSSSYVSLHPPKAVNEKGLSPALLHVPYYYTDIILPSAESFVSGGVLTVKGGFSTNPLDRYSCVFIREATDSTPRVTYYSSGTATNVSDTYHCIVPPVIDKNGFDGETLTVLGSYDPLPAAHMKGYRMLHLVPTGDDDSNTFTFARPPPATHH